MFAEHSHRLPFCDDSTLLDALAHAVATAPHKLAFRCAKEASTYSEFDVQTNQLANHLIALGVHVGDRVAICMPRSLDSVIAAYSVMKAGAVYVPIDPTTPDALLLDTLASCEVKVLISHPAMQRRWESMEAQSALPMALQIIDSIDNARRCASQAPVVSLSGDHLAYIIHTSGSTGRPKGIMHTHAGALRFAEQMIECCDLNSDDVIACHAPLHTDMSTPGLLVSPLIAATTEIIPEAHTRVPASLAALIASSGITVWYSVPLALVQLLQFGALERHDLSTLRWVIYAGEAFASRYVRDLMQLLPQARFSNMYGPAETNVCTFFHLPADALQTDLLDAADSIPVGQVWGDNQARVVDDRDEIVPPGEVGELLISSSTMMLGYWQRPDLDATVFFDEKTSSGVTRFYRTGDLVRECPEVGYRLVGRKDRQIKSRGFRVELDHIEMALGEMAGVIEVAAFTIMRDSLEIHVSVLPASDALTADQVMTHAMAYLPAPAVPVAVHVNSGFPRTTSGKIDRQQLAAELG